jgi:hypothetical protein
MICPIAEPTPPEFEPSGVTETMGTYAYSPAAFHLRLATFFLSASHSLMSKWDIRSRTAGRVFSSRLLWAGLYLTLIPLAAGVFTLLPAKSFISTNIRLEDGMIRDGNAVAESLGRVVRLQAQSTVSVAGTSFELPRDDVVVSQIRLLDDRAGLGVTINIHAVAANRESFVARPIELNLGSRTGTRSPDGSRSIGVAFEETTSDTSGFVAPSATLALTGSERAAGFLNMDLATYNQLAKFVSAGRGEVRAASGLYLRMLYFSATTATTLGFGDITPIAQTARLLVSAEAIVGVVLIGLFLNSIAIKRSRNE